MINAVCNNDCMYVMAAMYVIYVCMYVMNVCIMQSTNQHTPYPVHALRILYGNI